jgi:Asp-tRNA(Asn)/Glu-tRNA(Gln) amidotransferase A subunit family amidase
VTFHLLEATIGDIHRAMQAGELTCRQLVQLYLNRIAAYDRTGPDLHGVQTVNPAALAEAERLDAQLAASGMVGPLHGIPVLVKDQVNTSDIPTTYGSALFQDFEPAEDGTVVEKLRAAGAVVLAKTTMGEFAQSYAGSAFGFGRNPYDPTRSPSGSSCGTGIGVAANYATVGVGEDSGGSIRGPAACNNQVGLRPTLPLVSRAGMMPALPTRDTLGPMARTVRDTALLLDVLAGYDPRDPITAQCVGHVPSSYTDFLVDGGLRGMRFGIIREQIANDSDPKADDFARVHATFDQALRVLSAAGAEILDPVPLPRLVELLRRPMGTYETEGAIDAYLARFPAAPVKTTRELVMSPVVIPSRRTRLLESIGHTPNDVGYLQELHTREELRQEVLTAMADHNLDALLYPTFDHEPVAIPADIMTRTSTPEQRGNNRQLSPLLGFPALSVPAGFTTAGLPVGLELLGRPFSEGILFKPAYAYEQATHHRRPPTTTPALPGEP